MSRAALPGLTRRLLIGRACLLALAAVLMIASDAVAQDARSLTKEMVGEWELSTAGRDKTCIVTLKSDSTPQGLKLELDKGCGNALPFTKSIVAWSVKGLDIVRLQDAAGQSVIDVTEVESGIFEGLRQGEGVYLLQNLAAARALSKSADQLIGDWAMVRGSGKSICGLTLTNTETNTPENFAVYLKPRCDPLVAAFAPTVWRIERGELLLQSAKGEIWRFEADDNAQWRRIPDSADPLLLTRQ
ncbi:AprI/Inh family metalloprotease inhibitor [Afipia sp. DC4300-2b1]|uniref:AprI/Inh family metalloprotease inhibitor n=1 Tax=Afipia sp. DC4300-2b1 TaxID=2804672 RepID=UPI003CEBDB40